jgi:hypothetical protein
MNVGRYLRGEDRHVGTARTTQPQPPQRTEQCNYPDCKCPTENPCLKGLAQPEQEPVAWINSEKRTFEWNGPVLWNTPTVAVLDKIPLYTHPPQREWQGLTDDEREEATGWSVEHIEAKLREKNT